MASARLLLGILAACGGTTAASGVVLPGAYLLLHRASGRYLRGDQTLGPLDAEDALWDLLAAERPSTFHLRHAASGQYLRRVSDDDVDLSVREEATTWRIFAACRGTSFFIADMMGWPLTTCGAAGREPHHNDRGEKDQFCVAEQGGQGALWVMVRPCAEEGATAGGALVAPDCFPDTGGWSGAKGDCCAVDRHGPRGDPDCFDAIYTFERCCLGLHEQQGLPNEPASTAVQPPRILCSGERLEGEERYVKLVDFAGDQRWFKSSMLLRSTRFDFADEDGAPRAVRVVDGLPVCGGPALFDEASQLLPASERHMVKILRTLHNAMVTLAEQSGTILPNLAHSLFYLPFFPFLLMTLHRLFGDPKHLLCIASTVATLAQLPAWQRNAGYDFVLALGYDRPWERREGEGYTLQGYDPRLSNVLTLATHDAFFGDRHVVLQSNHGGAAYRDLRHVVVPLPFALNCSAFRRASEVRRLRAAGRRPLRFRASFAGAANGASRNLIRTAFERMWPSLTDRERDSLAIRFVTDDDGRRRLAQRTAEALSGWFGDAVASFDALLRESAICLTLPGDVSDLAMRFLHALSVGCTPLVVGGAGQQIPLPFVESVDYKKFSYFATVRDVTDAKALLRALLAGDVGRTAVSPARVEPPRLEDIAGLFTEHSDCGFKSGEPFLRMLARSLELRVQLWSHMRWFN